MATLSGPTEGEKTLSKKFTSMWKKVKFTHAYRWIIKFYKVQRGTGNKIVPWYTHHICKKRRKEQIDLVYNLIGKIIDPFTLLWPSKTFCVFAPRCKRTVISPTWTLPTVYYSLAEGPVFKGFNVLHTLYNDAVWTHSKVTFSEKNADRN